MKSNGKKSSSWEGITPEEKAERIKKMLQSRHETIATWKEHMAKREKDKQEALKAQHVERLKEFFHRPEWLAKFDAKDKELAIRFIKEALRADDQLSEILHNERMTAIETMDFEKLRTLNATSGERHRQRWATEHLLMLITNLLHDSISIEDFMKGHRVNQQNQIHDFSQISRLN